MALLTKEAILAASDIQTKSVEVPEWGGEVYVKGMTGAERDAFEAEIVHPGAGKSAKWDMANTRAKFCALVIVDDKGIPLFSLDDVKALGNKSAAALQRVFDAGRDLSGMSDKDIEELAGNLPEGQSDGSTSA